MKKLSTILFISFLAVFLVFPLTFLVPNANATPYTASLDFYGGAFYWCSECNNDNGFLIGKAHYDFDFDSNLQWDQDYDWTMNYDVNLNIYKLCDSDPLTKHWEGTDIQLGRFSLADLHAPFLGLSKMEWFPSFGAGYYLDGDHEEGDLYFLMTQLPCFSGAYALCFNGDIDFNANPVPEPATMLLLGSGLIGLAGFGRKKFFKN